MKKRNGGITLVALIITIIVLLVIAGVSLNAVIGENGILSQLQEATFLTRLQEVIYSLESEIVDINITNRDRKLTSIDTMFALRNRGALYSYVRTIDGAGFTSGKIDDSTLGEITISYNGDIWIDNYKRGKIVLSQITDTETFESSLELDETIYSVEKTVTVINGSVEKYNNNESWAVLKAIEDRDDFVCWVNSYGEIVSFEPNSIIPVNNYMDSEYTAIYEGLNYINQDGVDYRAENYSSNMGYFDTFNNKKIYGAESYVTYFEDTDQLVISSYITHYLSDTTLERSETAIKTSETTVELTVGGFNIIYLRNNVFF